MTPDGSYQIVANAGKKANVAVYPLGCGELPARHQLVPPAPFAAERKAGKTVRTYTEAVQWFAAAHPRRETGLTSWKQVGKQDIQRWIVWLLDRYSSAYVSNQYRARQQFFKWLAAEEDPRPHGRAEAALRPRQARVQGRPGIRLPEPTGIGTTLTTQGAATR